MKRLMLFITAIIIISILFCQIQILGNALSPTPNAVMSIEEIIITENKSKDSEDWLWETLMEYTDNNEKITAGILGYYWRESACQSDILAGTYCYGLERAEEMNKEFTQMIDEGLFDDSSREYFIYALKYQYGGYGLGQWSAIEYGESLFDFAQEWGTSIADAEMQCAFTVKSIQEHPTELWELIENEDSVLTIGRYIGVYYDGSVFGAEVIAAKAQEYYDRYAT